MIRLVLAVLLALAGFPAAAQQVRPALQGLRAEEDWSALRDPALRTEPFDRLKWIGLNDDGSWFLTFGGELRERYENTNHGVFGLAQPHHNETLLHRAYLFADIHLGTTVRLFVEAVNAYPAGWNGTAPATQEDRLDLLQGFAELDLHSLGGRMMLRLGRQEMSFGSSRLVSMREGPNVHLAFDGARAAWITPGLRVDAFVTRPVMPERGVFDDRSDPGQAFWGVYTTAIAPGLPWLKADLYYLGLDRADSRFAQGTARETRHSLGMRIFGSQAGFDWNFEGAFQFGNFGTASIRAWTVSSDTGFTFASLPLAPRIGLKADAISGDANLHDRVLGTFNPLFPKLPYFSEANVIAPANLLDIQPSLTVAPAPRVSVMLAWNPLWKQSLADAVYVPSLTPLKGSAGGRDRFIGQQYIIEADWAVTEHLSLGATFVHFVPGARLRAIGGRDGDFAAAWAQYRF